MSYPIISENGEYYIAVETKSQNIANTYTEFYYLYENPVTLEKDVLDENDEPVLDEAGNQVTEYVPSKLEMRKEPIEYLISGGNRVTKNLSGVEHWLIKMPKDFVIKPEYQPSLDKPKAEKYSIGGTYQVRVYLPKGGSFPRTETVLPFLPQRIGDYADNFVRSGTPKGGTTITLGDIQREWKVQILNLLNQKYG